MQPVMPLIALAVLAQIPLAAMVQVQKTERRAYARVSEIRADLLRECQRAEPAVRAAVAEICADRDGGLPLRQLARAFAELRRDASAPAQIALSPEVEFCSSLIAMVLPEVVNLRDYRAVHVTVHAPRIVPSVGECRFDISVADAAGKVVRAESITERTSVEDLMRYSATAAISLEGLPDGAYRVRVEPVIEGSDVMPLWPLESTVYVQRDYRERVEALPLLASGVAAPQRQQRVAELFHAIPEPRRDPTTLAILAGALRSVDRAYTGEPREPGSSPIADLELAERIYANLVADRNALDGVTGRVTIGLPSQGSVEGEPAAEFLTAQLDLRGDDEPRPLIVISPGVPAWTAFAERPSSPDSQSPSWTHEQLDAAGFDAERRFHTVVLESPGRIRDFAAAIERATASLRELLPVAAGQVVWIGEREAAFAVGQAAMLHPGAVQGIVLVAGGPLSKVDLARLEAVDILAVPAAGHPSTPGLLRLLDHAARPDQVEIPELPAAPWPIVLGLASLEIERFVARIGKPR